VVKRVEHGGIVVEDLPAAIASGCARTIVELAEKL
jgi:hypothetical protein